MSILMKAFFAALFFASCFSGGLAARESGFDLKYELEDILRTHTGAKAADFGEWSAKARPRILSAMNEIYGREPDASNFKITHEVLERSDRALEGLAKRVQLRIKIEAGGGEKTLDLLVYVPRMAALPAPAFLAISGSENFRAAEDFSILPSSSDIPRSEISKGRGADAEKWCVESILKRGYAFAIFNATSLFKDSKSGVENSVYTLEKNPPGPAETGAISAWAWGAKLAFEALKNVGDIDSSRVALIGHSRFGKAALVASARYPLFKLTILNNSGCMGAALSRRAEGETVADISKNFPYWFSENLKNYASKEFNLPLEQSEIMALVAPRFLYVASASEDSWADPKGEFMGLVEAGKVYYLSGKLKFPTFADYKVSTPFFGDCGWHLRKGGHNLTLEDWVNFIDYADECMFSPVF